MNIQFIRLTILLMASLIMFALSLELIWERFEPSETILSADDFYQSAIAEKGTLLNAQPITSVVLPKDLIETLKQGEIIRLTDDENQSFYYKLHQQKVLILGPITEHSQNSHIGQYIVTTFYLGFAVLLLIWFRPAFRDLRKLSASVSNFSSTQKWQSLHLKPTSIAYPAANTLNSMAERIEQLIELQRNLSRMIGHEIRTPLARTGFSIASLKHQPSLEEVLSIEEDLKEIEELTQEFLEITKLEFDAKDIVLVPQNIYPLVVELVDKLQKSSRITITIKMDRSTMAPIELKTFKRLMQNLVINALKHANDHVVIKLLQQNEQFSISVSDDGSGFSRPELVEKPYFQENINIDGYGLGLSIVKMIAAWYQGKIDIEQSTSLGGAKVKFIWPVK